MFHPQDFLISNQQTVIGKKRTICSITTSNTHSSSSLRDSSELLFHHGMPLSQVTCGTIRADPVYSADTYLLPAYEWLAEQIGFFPHFVSVGNNERALYRTGYQDNWKVWTGGDFIEGKFQKTYRKKGEFPNVVLLSFNHLEGVFMDYNSWHIAINACTNGRSVSANEMKMILKPSWTNRALVAGCDEISCG